jgi:hypothetical protein
MEQGAVDDAGEEHRLGDDTRRARHPECDGQAEIAAGDRDRGQKAPIDRAAPATRRRFAQRSAPAPKGSGSAAGPGLDTRLTLLTRAKGARAGLEEAGRALPPELMSRYGDTGDGSRPRPERVRGCAWARPRD